MKTKIVFLSFFLIFASFPIFSEILSKQGQGFLEQQQGQQVLHLKGTSYERGYQHGVLLKDQILRNIATYIDKPKSPIPGRVEEFTKNIPVLMSFVADHFKEEMQGLADGSGAPLNKIIVLNLFPEMFHCSSITVSGEASKNGELYHARVLDYSIGKNLQCTAVLQIVEPENGIAFLNVSYAGFIGTVTGMNQEKIAVGEIGGLGYGSWKGVPMAFLLRDVMEHASSLDQAKSILQQSPRTCEYYYIFSDGKTKESIGAYASASQLQFIAPGDAYSLIAASNLPEHYGTNGDNDKFVFSSTNSENTPYQTVFYEQEGRLAMLFRRQPENCLILTGYPNPQRYPLMIARVLAKYGSIDEKALIDIIKCPVAHESNLHNAIFKPSALKVWISHAGPKNEPACNQNYQEWDFMSLLKDAASP